MIEALANVEAAIDIIQLCSLHIPLESHLQIDLHARAMLVADPKVVHRLGVTLISLLTTAIYIPVLTSQVCSMGFSYFANRSG